MRPVREHLLYMTVTTDRVEISSCCRCLQVVQKFNGDESIYQGDKGSIEGCSDAAGTDPCSSTKWYHEFLTVDISLLDVYLTN